MILATFFLTHWAEFNYAEPGQPWYHAATWPNVFVILPITLLAFFYSRSKHLAAEAARAELKVAQAQHAAVTAKHAEHLKLLLDHIDPKTPGGIADVLDRLDVDTPGGLQEIAARIDTLQRKD